MHIVIDISWPTIDWGQVAGVLIVLALDAVGINQVWHSKTRGLSERIVWTAVILALPGMGYIGWQINWWFGKLANHLNRPRHTAT